jgi:hypothetical protein
MTTRSDWADGVPPFDIHIFVNEKSIANGAIILYFVEIRKHSNTGVNAEEGRHTMCPELRAIP